MAINGCPECLKKQRRIDALEEENQRLKQQLGYRKRKEKEGPFGSSTPSSKLPVKANAPPGAQKKKPGAKVGHKGRGRKTFDEADADRVAEVEAPETCPSCGSELLEKGREGRMVLESRPVKAERILYRIPKMVCSRCRRIVRPRPAGVLPKSLFGNQLVAQAASMHYLHGVPMGRVCAQIGIEPGSLMEIFHRLSRLLEGVAPRLVGQYRQSPVKHADETGWRTGGQNGYAWLFATDKISLFRFRRTRSASVCREVLAADPLPGVLVVDRYSAYNKAPCRIQYCYAHLLRDLEDLEREFEDSPEVKAFVSALAPLLAAAMGLRSLPIPHEEWDRQARQIKKQIKAIVRSPARHLGIRAYQELFRDHKKRLFHWARDRNIPADNNLAERDLRPTVIARKTSFGSQSDKGAKTRETLMTVLHTLKKQQTDPVAHFKSALDRIASHPNTDPFPLLFAQ
jgi:transposase